MNKFFGKYRGKVMNNSDPLNMGRVQVSVPSVLGSGINSWAMPCVPYAGPQTGCYAVPPIGANIWVEFEGGDPDYPILAGCFWGNAGEVPGPALLTPPAVAHIVMQTTLQNSLIISDAPGQGIMLKSATGAMIMINDTGIVISDGKSGIITITGGVVTVNKDGLLIK